MAGTVDVALCWECHQGALLERIFWAAPYGEALAREVTYWHEAN